MPQFRIRDRVVGDGQPCYVIAEMSANHGGTLEKALAIVRAAARAGADAVKLQTYTADTMTIDCDNPYFSLGDHPLWGGRTLYQLYQQASTPWEWHRPLLAEAQALGMHLFSTPFDESAVDFLETLEVPVYKIASFEMVDDPLLVRIAATGKPVIMSTGMASLEEIRHAVDLLRRHGTPELALLRCVSAYPARMEEMNLKLIPRLRDEFGTVVGLSDHTTDSLTAVAAVALGASIVEKHFVLGPDGTTLDAAFSLAPEAFAGMVRDIRRAQSALGQEHFGPSPDERGSLRFRRSIFVIRDIKAGERLTRENIRIIRPGHGLPPRAWDQVLGERARCDLPRGTPLRPEHVEGVR